uniref:tyrosine-type recombinase/integrase n=1 Tax=Ndongobacter massiliensis TaxID=1871025 RepID=UPI000931FEBC|nr:site-specific integrase [Ndongobacter massiliensis]
MPKNNVIKGSDGRYRYRTTDANGDRVELRSRAREKKGAFLKRCDAIDKASKTVAYSQTFDDLFTLWMQDYVRAKCSKAYYTSCDQIYRRYVKPHIGHRELHKVKRKDVYDCMTRAEETGIAASTVKKVRLCISAPYAWAQNTIGLDIVSPTLGLIYRFDAADKKGRNRVIAPEDMQRILDAAKASKYENYFHILAMTGMRPSEALGLKICDIDLKNDVLHIRRGITAYGFSTLKTALAKRDLPISDTLRSVLITQRDSAAFTTKEGWLFPSADGTPSMNAVRHALCRILRQTAVYERGGRNHLKKISLITPAVSCSLYDFRHTFATRMAERNLNPKMLQLLMGHSDIKITLSYYIDVTDQMIGDAKEGMEKMINF